MNLYLLIPLFVGCIIVLQGTLNRMMGEQMGLAGAVFLNSVIVCAMGALLYAVARWRESWLPELFHGAFAPRELALWMIFPGIFGFCIIAGVPWAISKLGAARVFVAIVVAQVVMSMIWDILFEGKPLTLLRVGGAALAIAGVVLVSIDQS